jgi:HAMP domain-containing protein
MVTSSLKLLPQKSAAIHGAKIVPGMPQSLTVAEWPTPFRMVARQENGRTIYLGLSSRGTNHLLRVLLRRFLLLWAGTVFIGFLISYMSAHRTLLRVERITETVGRIGSKHFGERLPEAVNSDEVSRLAKTFNRMLDRIQSSVTELRLVTDAIAHDVKSPLTSIRGSLESALSNEPGKRWGDSICVMFDPNRLLKLARYKIPWKSARIWESPSTTTTDSDSTVRRSNKPCSRLITCNFRVHSNVERYAANGRLGILNKTTHLPFEEGALFPRILNAKRTLCFQRFSTCVDCARPRPKKHE